MFLRKGTVILLPLGLLGIIALLLPLLAGMDVFFGSLLLGIALGVSLSLPAHSCVHRKPEPKFLVPPSANAVETAIGEVPQRAEIPLLRLLATDDARLITVEGAFAAYMITFSVRTGRGI